MRYPRHQNIEVHRLINPDEWRLFIWFTDCLGNRMYNKHHVVITDFIGGAYYEHDGLVPAANPDEGGLR